jgi:mannosyltransferase OCH1-like enzyme
MNYFIIVCSIIIILSVFIIILLYNLNKKKCEHFDDGSYKGYGDLLKDYKNAKYTEGGIPKIIFKTSWQKRNELPEAIHDVLKTTIILNPEYQLYYFDNDEVGEFMKAYSERAYNAYKKLKPGAYKADLFRYCVLKKYGGCYSDIGHMMHVSFDTICENNKLILVKDRLINKNDKHTKFDTGIHNALMCAVPHHPYMIKLVEACIKNIESEYYGYSGLCITGPILAGTVFYKLYDTNNEIYDFKNETEEVNAEMFNKHIKVGTRNNIKILQFSMEYILDINNKIILQRKFKDYYNIMYHNHNRTHYGDDWRNKNVYNN